MPNTLTHNPYDNAGPAIPGVMKDMEPTRETVADCAAEDLAAFDQLGPLTRAVINNRMVTRWSSVRTLQLIREQWHADPKHPLVDRKVADMVKQANEVLALKIREADPPTTEQSCPRPNKVYYANKHSPRHRPWRRFLRNRRIPPRTGYRRGHRHRSPVGRLP
jgi:hypothetical protein